MQPVHADPDPAAPAPAPALGLDVGGTHTRWALAAADGTVVAQGEAAGFSGAQLLGDEGRAAVQAVLAQVAAAIAPLAPLAALRAVRAGITGFDAAQAPLFAALAALAFGVPGAAVRAGSDIALLCEAAAGACVVYAGTGAIAAFVDEAGTLQRAGGRGALIDDAGGGHWIACRALRDIWRGEDAEPGAWQRSALARRVFTQVGGPDWATTRQWVYGSTRGQVGTLALAVAAAADEDPAALALLQRAGRELARLVLALQRRHGARPVVLAGRVFELHPAIEQSLRGALPAGLDICRLPQPPQHAAAALAAATLAA